MTNRPLTFAATLLFAGAFADAQILINELDADQVGTDAAEFVELVNAGISGVSLSGLSLVFFNGSSDLSYFALDLDPTITLLPGQFYVVGNSGVPNVSLQTFAGNFLQNGQDAVALYNAAASTFPNDTAVTAANLVDAVVYDTSDADDPGLLGTLTPGEPQIDENAFASSVTASIGRIPDGLGGPRQTDFYMTTMPTPGAPNLAIPEPSAAAMVIGGIGILALWRRGRQSRGF